MKRVVLAAAAATLLSGSAFAADIGTIIVPPAPAPAPVIVTQDAPSKLYISAFGGLLWVPDVAANAFVTAPTDIFVGTERGFRVGGAIGMQFTPMFGTELEVTFGRVAVSEWYLPEDEDNATDITEGTGTILTAMGNLTVGREFGAFRPYVAIGAGAARVGLSVPADVGFGVDGVDDTDWTWGAQALAGVDFAITDNITIGARYRFQHIGPTDFIDAGDDAIALDGFNTHGVEGVLTVHF